MSTSSDAPSDFDPYQQWLGLSPDERPYDHYCLLGLKPFENDRQVISNAAQRKMAELRKRRRGDSARHAQRLIAELSKATTCLLNANRKRLYDCHLRGSLDPRPNESEHSGRPPVPVSSPSLPGEGATAQISTSEVQPIRPSIVAAAERRVRTKQNPAILGGGIAVSLLVIIAAGIMLSTRGRTDNTVNDDRRPVVVRSPNSSSLTFPDQDLSPPPSTVAAVPSPVEPATATSPNFVTSEFELPSEMASSTSSSPATSDELPLPVEVPLPFPPTDDQPKSIRFAGTDRIALSEPLTSLDFAKSFTLEMWVRFEEGTNAHWLMGDLVLGNTHPDVPAGVTAGWQVWIMQTEAGKQRFAVSTSRGFWAEYPASAETWRHLAVSGDGTTVAIYVDGRRAASQAVAILADHHVDSPLPLHFGSHNYMHPRQPSGLQGLLRAVRISTDCRYRENFSPPVTFDKDDATELVFDFQHAESSRQINDLSGHARHGTLWGAQWLAMAEVELPPAASTVAATTPAPGADSTASTSTVPTDSLETPVPTKFPAPPGTEVQAARLRIEALLETEIAAAKRPAEQLALAAKMVSLAGESTDDRTTQFVLFEMAAKRLAQGNDLTKSLKVIDDFVSLFEIDRLARRADIIRLTGSGPLTLVQRRALAETALQAGEEMRRAGRFELAEEVAKTAVVAATRARSQDLGKRARHLRDQAKRSCHLAEDAELARQQLVTLPEDPAANLIYGKFLCLQMNQWDAGAAHLAKSDDEMLKQAAAAELKTADGADAQSTAADLWYAARPAVDKSDLVPLLEHVLELSRTAAPGLKGIARLSIEKRMQQIAEELPTNSAKNIPTKPALPRFEPPQEYQSLVGRLQVDGRDASILWKYRSGLRLANTNVADILLQAGIARGRVQIDFVGKLNLPETTTVNVMHQGGSPMDATATLFVDGKLIGVLGGENATSDVYKLDLAKGEHTVAWQLAGRDLAINSLRFTDAAEATPLVIYHDPLLLSAVRETPSRARLTVNLLGGPVNK